jgi:hypothetical protein
MHGYGVGSVVCSWWRSELGHAWEIEKREERWAAVDYNPIGF